MNRPAWHIRPFARSIRAAALAVPLIFFGSLGAHMAAACSFHVKLPDKTISDYLVDSTVVVLAREDPANQWTYRPVAVLKGDETTAAIDLFIPSTTRRRLANNPDDSVLLARSRSDGSWRRLAYVASENRALFERLVKNSDTWIQSADNAARLGFFAELQDHPDKSVQRFMLAEFDRATYRDLRQLEIRRPTEFLAQGLWQPFEQPWAPIRILLIGVRGDPEGRALVEKTITAAETTGWSMHLGAWAAALVEMEGEAGVERLRSGFLVRAEKPQQQIEAVLTALAVHGAGGDPDLRAAIDEALAELVTGRPDLVAMIARIFGAQGDYSRAPLLSATLEKRRLKSPSDIITVATYLSLARQSATKQVRAEP